LVSVEALFNGRHFDRQIIILCVSWYTSFKLSFRDLGIIMAERGCREQDYAVAIPRSPDTKAHVAQRLKGAAAGGDPLELALREEPDVAAVGRPEGDWASSVVGIGWVWRVSSGRSQICCLPFTAPAIASNFPSGERVKLWTGLISGRRWCSGACARLAVVHGNGRRRGR
jgi:hypothetical protein